MTHLILGLGNPGDEYQATRHNAGFRVLDELARRLGVRLNRLDCSSLVARAELAAPPVLTLHASAAPPASADAGGAAGAAPSGSGAASRVADAMPAAVGADGWEPSDTGSAAPAVVPVLLAKPQTYMNRSGFAARCLVESHGLDVARVLVVYDELNLPLGRLRLRRDGNPAGHRGMESIIESLRTAQVARLRVGIAPESGPPAGGDPLVDFVLSPFTAAEEEAFVEVVARAADACQTWLGEGIAAAMNRFNGG